MSGTITVLTREQWGADPALPPLGWEVPLEQFVGLVVHHTVMVLPDTDHDGYAAGDLDDIAAYMQRLQVARPDLGLDVPYSFVVLEGAGPDDAVIGIGRGYTRTGAHTANFNSTRWGVALAGDYTDIAPTPGMLLAIRLIGAALPDPIGAEPTLGHRDTVATQCPGNSAYPQLYLVQPPFTISPPQPEKPTMPDYVLRHGHNHNDPWLAVYPDGALRWIGGTEAGLMLNGQAPFDDPIAIVDELDTPAYNHARMSAGA